MMREIEAKTAGKGNGKKSGDEEQLLRQMAVDGMWLSSEVNMSNCVMHFFNTYKYHHLKRYGSINEKMRKACWNMRSGSVGSSDEAHMTVEQCQNFFQRYDSICAQVLIAHWMMAGYLRPVASFDEALRKGWDLITTNRLLMNWESEGRQWVSLIPAAQPPAAIESKHDNLQLPLIFFDLIDFDHSASNLNFQQSYQDSTIHELRSERMAYLVDYNPTPESLAKMLIGYDQHPNQLSALLIRGCDQFMSSINGNGILPHSTNLNSLTVVEISSSPRSPIDIGIISEMIHLEALNLSHLPNLETLPDNLFYKLRHLRWVIVRGCCKLRSFPSITGLSRSLMVLELSHCTNLQQPAVFPDIRYLFLQRLDLSYTPIFYGFKWKVSIPNLTHLSLRGSNLKQLLLYNKQVDFYNLKVLDLSECKHLVSLPPFGNFPRLEQLNLSWCICFTQFEEDLLCRMPCLLDLDLSWTKVKHLPSFTNLQRLSLRGLHLDSLASLSSMHMLAELDLAFLELDHQFELDFLPSLNNLWILNLSHTSVEKLAHISKLVSLRKLLLAQCHQMKVFPDLRDLVNLVELNLAGLNIPSIDGFSLDFLLCLNNLQILNLSHTCVEKLPDMSKLGRLEKLLLADCQQLKVMPDLSRLTRLTTLDLSLPDDCSIDNHHRCLEFEDSSGPFPLPWSLRKLVLTNRSGIHKLFPNNHLVSSLEFVDLRGTDVADSMLEQPKAPKAAEIHVVYGNKSQISKVERLHQVCTELYALISRISEYSSKNIDDKMITSKMLQLERLHSDFRYVIDKITCQNDITEKSNSRNWKIEEELLQQLIDAAINLDLLTTELAWNKKNKFAWAESTVDLKQLEQLVVKLKLLVPPIYNMHEEDEKKKTLIIMKESSSKIGLPKSVPATGKMSSSAGHLLTSYNSLSQVQKQCLLCFSIFPFSEDDDDDERNNICGFQSEDFDLVIRKKTLIYWWAGEGFIGPAATNRRTADEGLKSIEEIGKQILNVLVDNHFIKHVIKKGKESAGCWMHPFVYSFVIQRAKEEGFFDIDQKTCKLTPHFSRSRRACMLKPQAKFQSSCDVWAWYADSSAPTTLDSFRNVVTLFNLNTSMIDIKPEWFSIMEELRVLRLGNWRSESENAQLIQVKTQNFFKHLNRFKRLRLLSLQGWPTIMKLPDSVCELSNLIILDLKDCSYLEELPADIGSLKSLTHLDITNCPFLDKLPKGISLLSKLQVLKGFVITEEHAARASKDTNASILSSWFLSRNDDVCTLRDLLKLKWLRELSVVLNISMFPSDEEVQVFKEMKQLRKLKILWEKSFNRATEQGTLRKINLKCWGRRPRPSQSDGDDTKESKHLDNIEKLELRCFPHENAPEWLNPSELKNLEKLYIVGGELTKLNGSDTDENPWKVKALRLKNLHKMDIQWEALKNMFPQLMYLEKDQCDRLTTFPCDMEGVWKSTS